MYIPWYHSPLQTERKMGFVLNKLKNGKDSPSFKRFAMYIKI